LQYGLFLKVRTTLPSAYSIMLTKSDFGLAY
jgi:hypothetical protein